MSRPNGVAPKIKLKDQKRLEAQIRQKYSKERNILEKNIKDSENKIEKLESRKSDLETQIADPANYSDGSIIKDLQINYASI